MWPDPPVPCPVPCSCPCLPLAPSPPGSLGSSTSPVLALLLPICPTRFPAKSPSWKCLVRLRVSLVPPCARASSPLPESANHSFQCQPANWFILPPTQLSLPCRNEAISPWRRLPVRAAAGIINEDKVPAAQTISPTAPPAAASFIIRLSCRRELLNPDPCIRGLY